jgi:hypothetical protein
MSTFCPFSFCILYFWRAGKRGRKGKKGSEMVVS